MSLAPVSIFPECLEEGLSNREWLVSTHHFGHSWLGSDNAIPGGVGIRALDPFVGPGGILCDAGLGFGEPTGRSSGFSIGNSLFLHPPLPCPGYTFGIPLQGDPFRSTPPNPNLTPRILSVVGLDQGESLKSPSYCLCT